MPLIAMAHEIPYVATATVAELRDLEYKVERAMEFRGARYLHVFVPCPLGWGSASHDTIRIARLVKETGLFPVFEAEHGEVVSVSKIRRPVPVEEYLKPQRRYAHLFGDPPATDVIERIQAIADRNIERFGLLPDAEEVHRHDRASPLRSRSTSARASPTRPGPGAPSAPSTSTACRRATTPARPARTSSSGSTRPRRAATATSAPGGSWSRTTRSRRSWGGSATTPARPPATAASSTRPSASTRSSASSATRRSATAGSPR